MIYDSLHQLILKTDPKWAWCSTLFSKSYEKNPDKQLLKYLFVNENSNKFGGYACSSNLMDINGNLILSERRRTVIMHLNHGWFLLGEDSLKSDSKLFKAREIPVLYNIYTKKRVALDFHGSRTQLWDKPNYFWRNYFAPILPEGLFNPTPDYSSHYYGFAGVENETYQTIINMKRIILNLFPNIISEQIIQQSDLVLLMVRSEDGLWRCNSSQNDCYTMAGFKKALGPYKYSEYKHGGNPLLIIISPKGDVKQIELFLN